MITVHFLFLLKSLDKLETKNLQTFEGGFNSMYNKIQFFLQTSEPDVLFSLTVANLTLQGTQRHMIVKSRFEKK